MSKTQEKVDDANLKSWLLRDQAYFVNWGKVPRQKLSLNKVRIFGR